MKRISHLSLLMVLGCADIAVEDDGEGGMTQLPDATGGMDVEGGDMSSGGMVVVVTRSGGNSMGMGGAGTGGGLIGSGGLDSTGGTASGGSSSGGTSSGGTPSSGGTSSGGSVSTGGSPATGGTMGGGSPATCLLNWRSQGAASTCLDRTQDDQLSCENFLDCYQMNDCSPAECSSPDSAICGVHQMGLESAGLGYAETVFGALCP